MLARRIVSGTESFSWNLGASNFGGCINHDDTRHHRDAAEAAHKSYQAFCRRLGQGALSYESWRRLTDGAGPKGGEAAAFRAFHGYLPSEDKDSRLELQGHITARSRGKAAQPTYDLHTNLVRQDMRRIVKVGGQE